MASCAPVGNRRSTIVCQASASGLPTRCRLPTCPTIDIQIVPWSHIQSDRPHQLQCIASRDDAVAQMIVEADLATLQVILKMNVPCPAGKRLHYIRQSEVMG